jgi:cytochrome c oxidase subunit 3
MNTISPPYPSSSSANAAKVALAIFLAVVTALFGQFIHAYVIRMGGSDWRPLPDLWPLKVSTTALALASAALQWAWWSWKQQQATRMRRALLLAMALSAVFLGAQLTAWYYMVAQGYLVASNPANSFFFLITAVHGLHVAGGLLALGLVGIQLLHGDNMARSGLRLQLCTAYWHFLLVVWVILYGLLFLGSPTLIQTICSGF